MMIWQATAGENKTTHDAPSITNNIIHDAGRRDIDGSFENLLTTQNMAKMSGLIKSKLSKSTMSKTFNLANANKPEFTKANSSGSEFFTFKAKKVFLVGVSIDI